MNEAKQNEEIRLQFGIASLRDATANATFHSARNDINNLILRNHLGAKSALINIRLYC